MATDPEKWNAKEALFDGERGSRISKDLLKVVWEKPKPENDDGDDISSRHRDM